MFLVGLCWLVACESATERSTPAASATLSPAASPASAAVSASVSASVAATAPSAVTSTAPQKSEGASIYGKWRAQNAYVELGIHTFENWEVTREGKNDGTIVIRHEGRHGGRGGTNHLRRSTFIRNGAQLTLPGTEFAAEQYYFIESLSEEELVVKTHNHFTIRMKRVPSTH